MIDADIWFIKNDNWTYNVEIINIQIVPRKNTSYPYSEEYPQLEDEYNVVYLDTDNKIKHGVVSQLDDIRVL